MQMTKKLLIVALTSLMLSILYPNIVESDEPPCQDFDGDGRPNEFEIEQGLDVEESDVEWTFLVYCCGDDVPAGNRTGTLLPEMWEFIEKLSWVGCTDNITIVVQFDGTDVLDSYGNHQDMFWNQMQNNRNKPLISGTTTRRFLIGHDSKGWNPSIISFTNCTDNTVIDLYDVTDWDPQGTGKAHNSLNWEANMADPNTLFEFISWGMDTFPSDNYCLYIDSHGDGVNGFGYDFRPDNNNTTVIKDILNISEIQTVATLMNSESPPKELDMVMLQSCFMGNIEFCKEFSSFTAKYVASENKMHTTGNQDDKVLQQLDMNPFWSADRLAREFIDVEYIYSRDGNTTLPPWNIADWNGQERLTFSSMNITYMERTNIYSEMKKMNDAIQYGCSIDDWYDEALFQAVTSSTDWYHSDGYSQIDYYYFLNYWNTVSGPDDGVFPILKGASINISGILYNSNPVSRGIEYEKHDLDIFQHTKGIAIYCPCNMGDWLASKGNYQYSYIDQQTGWGHVIELMLARGPYNPHP